MPAPASLTYDGAGRVTLLQPDSGATTRFSYNPTGSVSSSVTGHLVTANGYDAGGLRVTRRVSSVFARSWVVYLGDTEVTVTNGAVKGRRVFSGPGGSLAALEAGGSTGSGGPVWSFVLADGQGSVRFTRDQATGLDKRAAYLPFGEVVNTSSLPGERGYLGKPTDPDGQVRLDHRSYQPSLNVLTAPDPLLNTGDPQSLNPYAYARNNPVTFSDPNGLEPRPWHHDPDHAPAHAYDAAQQALAVMSYVGAQLSVNPASSAEGGGSSSGWGSFLSPQQKKNVGAGFVDEAVGVADTIIEHRSALDVSLQDNYRAFMAAHGFDLFGPAAMYGRLLFVLATAFPLGPAGGAVAVPRLAGVGARIATGGLRSTRVAERIAAKTAPEVASGLERTGTALSKSDAFHRSVSWVVDNPNAQRFAIKGGDGVGRELYQLPGEVNGKLGVFEWIIDRSGTNPVINHQRFIPGGSVTGYPNQVVP